MKQSDCGKMNYIKKFLFMAALLFLCLSQCLAEEKNLYAESGEFMTTDKTNSKITVQQAGSGTYTATDGLGRTISGYCETGGVKEDKFVGVFYWTWHYRFAENRVENLTTLMKKYPEIKNDYDNPIWDRYKSHTFMWNEPLYGYYSSIDPWVLRRHAELLADAGVDVIIFDNTNGSETWEEGYLTLCEVFAQARADGVNTPQIAFMLPFAAEDNTQSHENTAKQLTSIYETLYSKGLYKELWFYWKGKPLIMAYPDWLDQSDRQQKEIYEFFTYRKPQPAYDKAAETENQWGWLSIYPQAVYYNEDGTPEQTTVGIAQNYSKERGLTTMNGENVFGRSYTSGAYSYFYKTYDGKSVTVDSTTENSKMYGLNFQQQCDYALKINPEFVFITGWNEWDVVRYESCMGIENAFIDEFTDEYSRDIEPSKGELKDCYYYQMVNFIRHYKGTEQLPTASEKITIDLDSKEDQWAEVSPKYISYAGNTFNRKFKGYTGTFYNNKTGRNDIVSAKVARDDENIYFLVECTEGISPYTDPAWMRLLIGVEGGADANWETYSYIINRENPTADTAVLERSTGGWNWSFVGNVEYQVSGNRLQIKVPKTFLGISDDAFTINFKWSDNMQNDGDIMDFYVNGDVTPGGRFSFCYTTEEQQYVAPPPVKTHHRTWGVFRTIAVIAVSALAVAVLTTGGILVSRRRNRHGHNQESENKEKRY